MNVQKLFENWARKYMRYPEANPDFKKNDIDDYTNHYVLGDWEAFKEGYQTAIALCMFECTKEYDANMLLDLDGDSRAGNYADACLDLRNSFRQMMYRRPE